MIRLIVLAGLAISLAACNNDSNNHSSTSADSSSHSAQSEHTNNNSGENHMKAMHDAMNRMMQQMQNMKQTGDQDYDFAMMMKHHHQGAIDMARSEIAGGSDEQLKKISEKLIEEQQKENAQFEQFLQGNAPKGNSGFGQKAMGMMTPISNIKMESSSLDAMFASMMIPHHQDALKMAQEYLQMSKNEDLKKIARNITETQPKEIEELQTWMNSHKK